MITVFNNECSTIQDDIQNQFRFLCGNFDDLRCVNRHRLSSEAKSVSGGPREVREEAGR